MTSYKERLNTITTFIFDIDGVLTNGDIIVLKGEMARVLNSRDGYALQYASKMGYRILVITGGSSVEVKNRLLEVGVTEVCLSSANKLKVYEDLKAKYNFSNEEVVYMGDDIPDYEVMQVVGLATCPQDAAVEIKRIAHYQSPFDGGKHCVRDIIEQTMRVQGKWFTEKAFEW
jgi:3-deoxy-D-manno-octulosonate 8-phosphate phosphatase (KDO 8-P phosphatase)